MSIIPHNPASTATGAAERIPANTRDSASQFARSGRVVFPLGGQDGKRPLVKWGGLCPGPAHLRQVESWWRRWPRAGIGLRTGDGLVVVDVDLRHGGAIDPAWPATLTARTRSGGFHLYYRSDVPVRCSVQEVAQGVDIRGQRGFVVAPPTTGWTWMNELELSELPESLTDAPHSARRRGDGVAGHDFELLDEVSSGGRNAYLARLAGWLWSQDMPEDEIESLLQDYNSVACVPALDPDEVRGVAASIARYHR
jgi:Bifunctional DNA primase/polymerase, N-terminal/Primase C terminal 1 (PriCT-1)